jgi:hypothetical protein
MTAARDPGLQAERTELAWRRTALSAAACSALLLHTAARGGWGFGVVPGVLTAAVALAVALAGRRGRRQRWRGGGLDRSHLAIGVLLVTACLSATTLLV